jgi:hypothetical protein
MATEYRQALELYQKNYLEYKVTGNSAYKVAYENAEKWIQLYLKNLRNRVESDKEYVSNFLEEYARTNPELDSMRTNMQMIQQKGPELQDQYVTIKKGVETTPEPDSTYFYVKVVAIAGLLGIAAAVGFL